MPLLAFHYARYNVEMTDIMGKYTRAQRKFARILQIFANYLEIQEKYINLYYFHS